MPLLIDARSVSEGEVLEADVCIVGAGAAGITLARELAGRDFRVCLLESGGLELDQETQSLCEGQNVGLPYFPLDVTRLRYFGGSTNHWNGWCRPLEAVDFEARPWLPHSGWPFGKTHLEKFYERAQSICQLGPFEYESGFWEGRDESRPIPFGRGRVVTRMMQLSPPTRFGEVYRSDVTGAANVRTLLHANVVEIETDEAARSVTRLRAATLEGKSFRVSGKLFILAAGGIEVPRLLLASDKVQRGGLGNQNDLVGRYFMEHIHLRSGVVLHPAPSVAVPFYQPHLVGDTLVSGILTVEEGVLREEKMLNFCAAPWLVSAADLSKGLESLRFLRQSVRQGKMPDDLWRHLGNIVFDIDDVATYYYRKMRSEGHPAEVMVLENRAEQLPDPASRVTLGEERDRLGMRRVKLDWRLSASDKASLRRAHEIIAQELGADGLGRLRLELEEDDGTWPPSLHGGHHHMGTTRMHLDPKRGVVDENCRVHGISNLYVAGPSVFPTAGYANPMLTIVALAVRLADHVKGLMG